MLLHKYFWSKRQWLLCFHFLSRFLPNLGRMYFGGLGEKTPKLHWISLPFSLPIKQRKKSFSLIFSSPLFPSSSKSPQSNGLLVVKFVLGCLSKKFQRGSLLGLSVLANSMTNLIIILNFLFVISMGNKGWRLKLLI